MSQVTTLYVNEEKTEALYPRTKVAAISDDNNVSLQELLDKKHATIDDTSTSDLTTWSSKKINDSIPKSVNDIASEVETWSFTLSDGTVITRKVTLGD